MPTYRSRRNPRKQLVMLGERVRSAETYDCDYDIGWESFQRGVLPCAALVQVVEPHCPRAKTAILRAHNEGLLM